VNIYETNEELRNLSSHNSTRVFECRKMGSAKYVGRVLDKKRLYNSWSEEEGSLRISGLKSEKIFCRGSFISPD